ncbi:hypothetical protein BCEP4_70178 [Burkholderia cepacia]|nr:hypothetical protein BCEP4_70178 [Burkholderia cepacia]
MERRAKVLSRRRTAGGRRGGTVTIVADASDRAGRAGRALHAGGTGENTGEKKPAQPGRFFVCAEAA